MLELVIPIKPVPQPRQQFRVVWPSASSFLWDRSNVEFLKDLKKRVWVQNYARNSEQLGEFRRRCKHFTKQSIVGDDSWPCDGPLRVELALVFPRTQAQIWKTKPMPRLWHAKKPDKDNLEKAIFDALEGVLWNNDSQIARSETVKIICGGAEQPCVAMRVERLSSDFVDCWADDLLARHNAECCLKKEADDESK